MKHFSYALIWIAGIVGSIHVTMHQHPWFGLLVLVFTGLIECLYVLQTEETES